MAWSDLFNLGALITALCIFLAGAVTIHAALEGRLSRGWAIAWLIVFAGLGVVAVLNSAREAGERRQAEDSQTNRIQHDDERWNDLYRKLGLSPFPEARSPTATTPSEFATINPSQLFLRPSPGQMRKFVILVRAMGPYAAHVYHTKNPLSVAVASDFERALKAADWQVRGNDELADAGGLVILSTKSDDAKAAALTGLLGDFGFFSVMHSGSSQYPADEIGIAVGDPDSRYETWIYLPGGRPHTTDRTDVTPLAAPSPSGATSEGR